MCKWFIASLSALKRERENFLFSCNQLIYWVQLKSLLFYRVKANHWGCEAGEWEAYPYHAEASRAKQGNASVHLLDVLWICLLSRLQPTYHNATTQIYTLLISLGPKYVIFFFLPQIELLCGDAIRGKPPHEEILDLTCLKIRTFTQQLKSNHFLCIS